MERFGAAAAQLGATDVAVRIAGVYAMARVADESDGLRRQQCIDVLCGYLRLPYDTEHGASGRTRFVIKAPRVEHGRVRGETEETVEYRQNDREVRATIVRVIADHLRPDAEYSWSLNNFDFRTAHMENAVFDDATFAGTTRFDDAAFAGPARFDEATFAGRTLFAGAAVAGAGSTEIDVTSLPDFLQLRLTTFAGPTWFDRTSFAGDTQFRRVNFEAKTDFTTADFGTGLIDFSAPRGWGPPAPQFAWDSNEVEKPENVKPQEWPPP
ncbi:pentapeptide repeat-containing protein [Nocardia sp. CA-290969]|uniref:pentapeptide repeat-containing protein n=1 Tax=Nocardia sp. CA-290969 TaxID=3239986 RepID=UPI003D8F8F26